MQDIENGNHRSTLPQHNQIVHSGRPQYDIVLWFGQAWRLFKAKPFMLAAVMLIQFFAGCLVFLPRYVFFLSHSKLVVQRLEFRLIYLLLYAVFLTPLVVGAFAVMLNYVRTGLFGWEPLGKGFRKWGDCFMLGLWPSAISGIFGWFPCFYSLLLFPIELLLALWINFTALGLCEEDVRYRQALSKGFSLITMNFWQAMLFQLFVFVIGSVGVFACCVGIFFSYALSQLLLAVGYNNLTLANSQSHQSC